MADSYPFNYLVKSNSEQEIILKPFRSLDKALGRMESFVIANPQVYCCVIERNGNVWRWADNKAIKCPHETEVVAAMAASPH